MIDISKLIRETFTAERLENHIFKDCGGSSSIVLEFILMEDSKIFAIDNLVDNLERYGPGLVSFFKVHEDFQNKHKFSYVGIPEGKIIGLHAMVLIGHRKGMDVKVFYLLQNWWKEKQFVEVDV